jgi:hypothetical protein
MPELIEPKFIPEENEDEKIDNNKNTSEKSEVSLEEKKKVKEMMEKKNYTGVIAEISDWELKKQESVVKKLLEKKLNKPYSIGMEETKGIFALIHNWPSEKSYSIIEKALRIDENRDRNSFMFLGQNYYNVVAETISNWPEEKIRKILNNDKNMSWTKLLAEINYNDNCSDEQRKQKIMENSQKKLNNFRLHILSERTALITDEMVNWIKDGLKELKEDSLDINFDNNKIISHILEKHPEIVKGLVPDIFLSGNERALINATNKIQKMDIEEQYKYSNIMTNGFSNYHFTVHEKLRKIVTQWDYSHKTAFIRNLFIKGNSNKENNASIINDGFYLLESEVSISDPEIIKSIIKYSVYGSISDYIRELAKNLISKIEKNEKTEKIIKDEAIEAILMKISEFSDERYYLQQEMEDISEISKKYELGPLSEYKDKLPPYTQSIIKNWNLNDIEQVADFFEKNQEYVSYLRKNPDQPCLLTSEDLPEISKLHLNSLIEAEQVKSKGLNLSEIKTEEDYQKMFEALKKTNVNWQDEENISGPFEKGAETFGYEKMFKYIDRENLSRHDGLYTFEKIIELYKYSGLTPEQFYNQILNQVQEDEEKYKKEY